MGLTYEELGELTGVGGRQVQNWAAGTSKPSDGSRDRLVDVYYIVQQLGEVYRPEGVEIWLRAKNRTFRGRRPLELLLEGDLEPVFDAVERLASGAA
ncbi:MAG TPA: helix-turn-helix transcriptional regulator [Nitriliruptorales bacterium]